MKKIAVILLLLVLSFNISFAAKGLAPFLNGYITDLRLLVCPKVDLLNNISNQVCLLDAKGFAYRPKDTTPVSTTTFNWTNGLTINEALKKLKIRPADSSNNQLRIFKKDMIIQAPVTSTNRGPSFEDMIRDIKLDPGDIILVPFLTYR